VRLMVRTTHEQRPNWRFKHHRRRERDDRSPRYVARQMSSDSILEADLRRNKLSKNLANGA